MKKVFVFSTLFVCASALFAAAPVTNPATVMVLSDHGSDNPPAAVVNSFHSIFGNVPVQEWKKRSHNQWRAHFIRNGVAWEATFNTAGALIKSEPA